MVAKKGILVQQGFGTLAAAFAIAPVVGDKHIEAKSSKLLSYSTPTAYAAGIAMKVEQTTARFTRLDMQGVNEAALLTLQKIFVKFAAELNFGISFQAAPGHKDELLLKEVIESAEQHIDGSCANEETPNDRCHREQTTKKPVLFLEKRAMTKTLSLLRTRGINYADYMRFAESMVAQNRTSGPNQSEMMLHYTKLNLKRMQRLNKTVTPSASIVEQISRIPFQMRWVIITEIWCGDAAQNIPYIAKLAGLSPNVSLELVMRDENEHYMEQFLTHGTRSIPKLIVYNTQGDVMTTWGPRPAPVQDMVMDYKKMDKAKPAFDVFATALHQWYTSNKNQSLESELLAIFRPLTALQAAH